ncbi:hypothetical protein FHS04_002075 [Mesoflavibacter sabulilitoris]|uniref:Uncharacterized protein n=1 Tax=Mesoflavibacter zeaxanthinifaciens subsp. sabulilitoris TaxID=1520893 RepID=A0A2T1NM09_9FLAO|nr:hypothetical protein [Mesoflavibacter zeaxanthinifaciens]MBB3124552.1 hypothetical protein [Mesoflavibacter zeaxanthinifaciens subsp. sabulilitoris]PSG93919.1 hypothetical protein C7H61_01730 [Mesoflavibacter zeaxanthinifaciens subsp. sabulilitoris]
MKLVTRDNIESWADTTFSKAALPYLISRLVRATTPASTKANLPSGSATYIGGWDGIVNCESETAYVPKGTSLWEFGTNSDIKGKADSDYNKRKCNPIGFTPKDSVFVFVTPRLWSKKDEWVKEKKAENHWKDVIVYDSVDIEQWLDIALSVSRWFAAQDGVGTYPFDGIMTADEFWEEWSIGAKGLVLLPESIIAGREYEKNQLLTTLQGDPTIKGIKASTKNEAIAFIIAAAKTFPVDDSDRFFSKALIIDTEGNFRGVRINTNTSLNLIPRFDEAQPLYAAVSKGHHVLVPLGADDDFNQETITLPTIDRDGQINSLIKSGVSKDEAEKFSRESGRNITILKKLLGFPYNKAKWFFKEDIREIIPALLLGRWNETFVGDIELIEQLSNQKYADYLITLNKWKNFEESPIIQIGETWRLTSPLDLWTNLSTHLTENDFKNLQQCFSQAFKNGNPIIKPKDENDFAASFNKKRKYSNWSREGLTQSLILVGRLGDSINIPNLNKPQNWVDNIVLDLLYNATGETWVSVDHELPLISEASPDSFLKSVNNSLVKGKPEIMEMFEEEDGFLHKTSHHTGLLWALENLAWLPEYLRDTSLILLQLSRLDPGGNLSNRPLNSITEIFKPWHYQTLASYDERMAVLKYITEREQETGWSLLIRMLPEHHGVAHPTHKMRWRMFDKNTNLKYTYQEIWDTHSTIIEMLIELFDYDENKFSQLINEVTNLSPKDRDRVLTWADEVCLKVEQKSFATWATIRKILNHHRSHPDTDWALPEAELKRLEVLYYKLQPSSTLEKYIWLFNDHWPEFPEGFVYKDNESEKRHEQQQKRIDDARKDAVTNFTSELGLEKTLELRNEISQLWAFGYALADVITEQEGIFTITKCLYDDENKISFIHSFIYRKSIKEGFDWIKALFNDLQEKGYSFQALSNVLIPINQNQELWDFISALNEEIQNLYWQNVRPHFYHISDAEKVFGVKMLLTHKRFFSSIDVASHFPKVLPTNLLSEMLQKAGTEESSETTRFKGYEIERIFEEIDNREDIEKSTLIQLEWIYLPILDSYGTRRNPINLEEELANNPEFFIDVLKWIYIPKDKTLLEEERKGISDEVIKNRAKQSYHLLNSWKKIPGMKDDNSINEVELKSWIDTVRELAKSVSRLEVADMQIGKVLAQYPENIPEWPQETIFKIIEEINSDSIKSNYSSALFNKRGSSSRGAFDGGDIEREKAAYFEKLEKDYKNKYPNVAEIFKRLSDGYLFDAKRMDDEAERRRLEY